MIKYDVIVIGGGHAGCEAAAAACRVLHNKKENASVLLLTFSKQNIGQMSCNPSIGGVGKGIIVKEIDALDGVMPRAIDQAAIHYKTLNSSRGPAVWGPRAQADRELYQKAMLSIMEGYDNLSILYDEVTDIRHTESNDYVVYCQNKEYLSKSVVITTGTFLNGKMYMGDTQNPGGRYGELSSQSLHAKLSDMNIELSTFKTGTPARIKLDTIDFSKTEEQKGETPIPFSSLTESISVPQISCYITRTNSLSHSIIRDNIQNSYLFSRPETSAGPRYCPSIEDKVLRFHDKDSHQIFLEPEGLNSNVVYPNGISTSMPQKVQDDFIRSIKSLENAEIIQYGYAVEYSIINPVQLSHTLQLKKLQGLFFAGQINGTTGYEEAAGQGLIAGTNAALQAISHDHSARHSTESKKSNSEDHEFRLTRSDSYIGVMIDDLVTKSVQEPYRIMTSRAEFRLMLRPENADYRLLQKGRKVGLITDARNKQYETLHNLTESIKNKMENTFVTAKECQDICVLQDGQKKSLMALLGLPKANREAVHNMLEIRNPTPIMQLALHKIYVESVYMNYSARQTKEIAMLNAEYDYTLPQNLDFAKIMGLSAEVISKLASQKPKTIANIRQIDGITPTAILAIQLYLKKHHGY